MSIIARDAFLKGDTVCLNRIGENALIGFGYMGHAVVVGYSRKFNGIVVKFKNSSIKGRHSIHADYFKRIK